jgi:hypothetical protein
VHLRIAGFTIHVTCAERELKVAPSAAAARFLVNSSLVDSSMVDSSMVEPAAADVEIAVAARNLDGQAGGECLFDSGGPWRLYRDGDGFLFRFFSSTLSTPYKIARFNRDFSLGRITLHRPFFAAAASIDPLEYPLDELLVLNLLSRGQGVEIHGCGAVVDGSSGYLFAGQSGAGKTTLARICLGEPGAVVLSDDRVILRDEADGLWMYGTPWHGDEPLASPQRARLAAIFFLHQHHRQEIAAVARPDSVARLFAASFPLFYDASALDFTLAFLERVAAGVPCYELGFMPDATVLAAVRKARDRT